MPVSPLTSATKIARALIEAGFETYFVGGCVRDMISGEEPNDMDIATMAHPEQVLKLFPNARPVGVHFGVVIIHKNGHNFEVATFRRDGLYLDSRRPSTVSFASAKEDVLRRDFTINGILQHPLTGEILDFVGGLDDLKQHILRCIGNPAERFQEDALRLLRAVRFSCTKTLTLEHSLYQALKTHSSLLQRIAPERIQEEFNKMLLSPAKAKAIELLIETKLMDYIIPELNRFSNTEIQQTKKLLEALGDTASLELTLAGLLLILAPNEQAPPLKNTEAVETILRRLKYSNKIIHAVAAILQNQKRFNHAQQMGKGELWLFTAQNEFMDSFKLYRADCLSSSQDLAQIQFIEEFYSEFGEGNPPPKAWVSGNSLIQLGFQPCPAFKHILQQAYWQQLEGKFADPTAANEWAKQQLLSNAKL